MSSCCLRADALPLHAWQVARRCGVRERASRYIAGNMLQGCPLAPAYLGSITVATEAPQGEHPKRYGLHVMIWRVPSAPADMGIDMTMQCHDHPC